MGELPVSVTSTVTSGGLYEACPESKDRSRVGRYGNFYAYYGNTAIDLDPLPVSPARLTVVESALFE